ncbi:hypothetical protein LR48_Vigan11g026600 [Vigna angularis]|uniref:Aminotransferase-like plant mobile domain-containing protein n=1 Tax=Phaseolus angularis TaxID=3914 RepID=A0A0L9VR51_PHAAN|nr:hypothetical protein LR48_Vigan11g026600 [Vigna angularis]
MESSNNNWRLRAWIHTSYIANMNSLLAATHKMRISQTPFKWCLEIGDPLELWAYERLGLHDDNSAKEFPRVRRFSSLNYTTKKIDVMFKTAEVQFDWYLSENDCLNPIIRRAFNLDEEGSKREEKVEEKVAENEYDENWLLSTLEKLRTNNARIRKVRDEIAAVRKLLADRVKHRKVEPRPNTTGELFTHFWVSRTYFW